MNWFDVFKEDEIDEKEFGIVQESAMKILDLISEGRDNVIATAEPIVQDLIKIGLDEKDARKMVNGILAPMMEAFDEKEADMHKQLEELGNYKKR